LRNAVLDFPNLLSADCFYFEACGKLRGVKEKKERSQKIARARLPEGTAYLRLLEGGESPGHLHIDIAMTRFFPKARPEVNSTRAEISRDVSQYFGKKIDLQIFAQFVTLVEDIQPGSGVVFGGPNAIVSTINNATVEVRGAHLVIRNDPFVRMIDWQLFRGDTVFVDISAIHQTVVSPSYLSEVIDKLRSAYRAYVIGRTSDATP
jgi:hypothetical protein